MEMENDYSYRMMDKYLESIGEKPPLNCNERQLIRSFAEFDNG